MSIANLSVMLCNKENVPAELSTVCNFVKSGLRTWHRRIDDTHCIAERPWFSLSVFGQLNVIQNRNLVPFELSDVEVASTNWRLCFLENSFRLHHNVATSIRVLHEKHRGSVVSTGHVGDMASEDFERYVHQFEICI